MTRWSTVFACVVTSVITAALLAPTILVAQTRSPYTAPRTPWGDPDLQGNYSNNYEQGTPFERPAEFDGRRIEGIRGQELAAPVRERAAEVQGAAAHVQASVGRTSNSRHQLPVARFWKLELGVGR